MSVKLTLGIFLPPCHGRSSFGGDPFLNVLLKPGYAVWANFYSAGKVPTFFHPIDMRQWKGGNFFRLFLLINFLILSVFKILNSYRGDACNMGRAQQRSAMGGSVLATVRGRKNIVLISLSEVGRLEKRRNFPSKIKISADRVAWLNDDPCRSAF